VKININKLTPAWGNNGNTAPSTSGHFPPPRWGHNPSSGASTNGIHISNWPSTTVGWGGYWCGRSAFRVILSRTLGWGGIGTSKWVAQKEKKWRGMAIATSWPHSMGGHWWRWSVMMATCFIKLIIFIGKLWIMVAKLIYNFE